MGCGTRCGGWGWACSLPMVRASERIERSKLLPFQLLTRFPIPRSRSLFYLFNFQHLPSKLSLPLHFTVTANLSNPHFTLSKPPTSNSALSLSSTFPTPQKYKIISSVNGTQLASVTVPGNGSVGVASGDVVVPQGAVVRAVRVTEGSGDGVTGGVVGGNGSNGTVVTTTKPSGVGRKKPGFVEVGLVGFVVVGLGLIV